MQLDLLKHLSVWLRWYLWQSGLSRTTAHHSYWGILSNAIPLLNQETSQLRVRLPLSLSVLRAKQPNWAWWAWERERIRRMLNKAWLYKTGSINLTGRTNELPSSRFHCVLFICINNLKDRCSAVTKPNEVLPKRDGGSDAGRINSQYVAWGYV